MTHALQIDTLAFSKKLREAGADEALAEAIVEGLTAADTSELATKGDVAELDKKIDLVAATLKTEIAQSTNKAIYTLGGLVGILFIIDRIIPLFGVGN